jgi:hypothetical protein
VLGIDTTAQQPQPQQTPTTAQTPAPAQTQGPVLVQAQTGGDPGWPNNEYTRKVPKPDFQVKWTGIRQNNGMFGITFTGVDQEQVKTYDQLLKASGYNRRRSEEDDVYGNYSLYALNSQNQAVALDYHFSESRVEAEMSIE